MDYQYFHYLSVSIVTFEETSYPSGDRPGSDIFPYALEVGVFILSPIIEHMHIHWTR